MKPKQKIILILYLIFSIVEKNAAQNLELTKQSPAVAIFLKKKIPLDVPVSVIVTDVEAFKKFLKTNIPTAKIHFEYPLANALIVSATENNWLEKMVNCPLVQFIDQSQKIIKEELKVPGHNLSVNRINAAHADFPSISGKNITISIKENTFDGNDIDFRGRFIANSRSNNFLVSHSNLMATLIGGAGNTSALGQGVAYGSQLLSSGFNNLFPEPLAYFDSLNISVQNHSYGTSIENYYGTEGIAYDKLIEAKPTAMILFSAGNSGKQMANNGIYTSLPNYANLTGNFKMAKNILVVGSVDSFGVPDPLSSRGPAYDGRLKPDLVAFSPDGTSGATALVSGSAALVQQAIMDKQKISEPPPSALVKAILLNSADDVGAEGIDFVTGYGNLNARRALETVVNGQFKEGNVKNAETWTTTLKIPRNIAQLKLTLVWLDPSVSANVQQALTHDLDLELENKLTGEVFQPWVLNSRANLDSLKLLPTRQRDSLNNVEQITITQPTAGDYTISVIGKKVATSRPFYIVYQLDTAQTFKWTFPKTTDNVLAENETVLRWETTFKNANTVLKYKNTEGSTWVLIDSFFNIEKQNGRWQVPNALETAQLCMDIEGHSFVSDTFFISKKINFNIAFNCTDSVGFFWTKLSDSIDYQLFTLGKQYLEPIKTLRDTFIVLKKRDFSTRYFTVSALLKKHFLGIKSPTPDYALQGVACYYETFFADLKMDNTIALSLTIASTYNLKKLIFERWENGQFKPLAEAQANALTYEIIDAKPQYGRNIYRVRIETRSNQSFLSEEASVFYLDNQDYVVFPNPITHSTPLSILSKNQEENVRFRLFDALGRLILEQKLNTLSLDLPMPVSLAAGIYFYRIEKSGKTITLGKLYIL